MNGKTPNLIALSLLASTLVSAAALSASKAVVDTLASPHVKFQSIDLDAARWTDGFWADRWEVNRCVSIPAMKQLMELPTNPATFYNLRVAAGEVPGQFLDNKWVPGRNGAWKKPEGGIQGQFFGNKWSDGDCYKWIEAAASVYCLTRDSELDRQMDEVIAVIAKAQAPDGFICTQIQLTDRGRWASVGDHELYNMGHLLTAACIHHRVTGKNNFLAVARKAADYLYTVFEPRPKELAHMDFNPSNIMGAVELYRTTGERKYLRLADIFVTMRGSQPGGTDETQDKVPLRAETEAVGHAVTATYLWCGAADVYAETGEPALFDALERLWQDVTSHKMYITGGVGALHHGLANRAVERGQNDPVHEAFGALYELPNSTAYNETCANIGNAMWNWRMLMLTGDAKYADGMEGVWYNSLLSAIGLEGKDSFYTNPLRRGRKDVLEGNDSAERYTTPAPPAHPFCCPPSLIRTIAQLHTYAYGLSTDAVWIHLYGGSRLDTQLPGGAPIKLSQQTDYPWNGKITIRLEQVPATKTALRLRIPAWVSTPTVKVNNKKVAQAIQPGSYCEIRRSWSVGDTVELDLPMPVVLMGSHPRVEENRNHVAAMRGPLVYCLESVDLPKGVAIENVRLPRDAKWKVRREPNLLHGVTVLETRAQVISPSAKTSSLYHPVSSGESPATMLRLIPYYAWCNRGIGEMTVWLPLF